MSAERVQKALVYALHHGADGRDRLLVFSEPGYPEAGTQVPGGTVEDGETPADAARREFAEETGLDVDGLGRSDFVHFATVPWPTQVSPTQVSPATQTTPPVERHCFALRLTEPLPGTWDHVEQTPHGGGGPIVVRFRWMPFDEARSLLSVGMGDVFDKLPSQLARNIVALRSVRPDDAEAIASLMRGLGFDHAPSEIVRRLALSPDRSTDPAILAECDGRAVGLLALHIAPLLFYPAPLARITTLVVDKDHRRRGIGKRLVKEAARIARERESYTLELASGGHRSEAHAFYEMVGFERSALRLVRALR